MTSFSGMDDLEEKIKDLKFKVSTTPRWMGRFIYEHMLSKCEYESQDRSTNHTRLNLCHGHRQEQNASHYSPHNCDYCQAISPKLKHTPKPVDLGYVPKDKILDNK